mmetsp:Transcript_133890/g.428125  ORF Transcript_133890/g.428125 Transcript_133890/m.428125 type:complete len:247 (-) Transcript_133890:597-1337(-)
MRVVVHVLVRAHRLVVGRTACRDTLVLELQVVHVLLLLAGLLEVAAELERVRLVHTIIVRVVADHVEVQDGVHPLDATPDLPNGRSGRAIGVIGVVTRVVIAGPVLVEVFRLGHIRQVLIDDPPLLAIATSVAVVVVVHILLGLVSLEVTSSTGGVPLLHKRQALQEVLVRANTSQPQHHQRCRRRRRRASGRGACVRRGGRRRRNRARGASECLGGGRDRGRCRRLRRTGRAGAGLRRRRGCARR